MIKHLKTIFFVFVCWSSTAFAGLPVFDGVNWVSNYSSAASALKNEVNTYTTRMQQLIQISHEIRNLKAMGVSSAAARALDVENELRALKKLKDAATWLYTSVKTNQDFVTGINKMIYVSNVAPEAWVERERRLAEQKNAGAMYLMETAKNNVEVIERAQKQRDQVLASNDYDEGIRSVAMKTNVLLGNMATVQSQMLTAMTVDANIKSTQMAMETEKYAKEKDARDFLRKKLKKAEEEGDIFK